jgi:hypothetical protein
MSEVFQQQNIINIRGWEMGYHVLGATLKNQFAQNNGNENILYQFVANDCSKKRV